MDEAELHFLHTRMIGGKENAASRGELRFPLPVGYIYNPDGKNHHGSQRKKSSMPSPRFSRCSVLQEALMDVPGMGKSPGELCPTAASLQPSTPLPMLEHMFMDVTAITKPLMPMGISNTILSVSQIRMSGKSFSPTIIRLISLGKSSRKTRIALIPTVQTRNGAGPAREGAALLIGILIRYTGTDGICLLYECVGRWEHGNKATCSSVPAETLDHAVSEKNTLHHEAFRT